MVLISCATLDSACATTSSFSLSLSLSFSLEGDGLTDALPDTFSFPLLSALLAASLPSSLPASTEMESSRVQSPPVIYREAIQESPEAQASSSRTCRTSTQGMRRGWKEPRAVATCKGRQGSLARRMFAVKASATSCKISARFQSSHSFISAVPRCNRTHEYLTRSPHPLPPPLTFTLPLLQCASHPLLESGEQDSLQSRNRKGMRPSTSGE